MSVRARRFYVAEVLSSEQGPTCSLSREQCEVILAFYRPTSFLEQVGWQMHSNMTTRQEISEHLEPNDLGQVKIASSAKVGKWVWVNAKQYRGILKRRITCLKWE